MPNEQGCEADFDQAGSIPAGISRLFYLLDIDMDVWETVQHHTLPIPAEQLKREYGNHLTFFGGINTQRLPLMTPDEVAEKVNRCIRVLGKKGGYFCGPDHRVKPDVSAKNALILFKTATEFRVPGYTLG